MHPNEAAVRRLFAAHAGGDVPGMRQALASNVVYHIPGHNPISGDYHGIDAVLALWDEQASFLGERFTPQFDDVLASDDHVVVLASARVEDPQHALGWRMANVYRLVDGLVAECRVGVVDGAADFDAFWSRPQSDRARHRAPTAHLPPDSGAAATPIPDEAKDRADAEHSGEASPIAVVAELRAVPGAGDRVAAAVATLLDGLPGLPGTTVFAVHRSPDDENLIMVYEVHHNEEAFQRADAAAAAALGQSLDSLLVGPPTVRFFRLNIAHGLPAPSPDPPK